MASSIPAFRSLRRRNSPCVLALTDNEEPSHGGIKNRFDWKVEGSCVCKQEDRHIRTTTRKQGAQARTRDVFESEGRVCVRVCAGTNR